MDHRFGVLSGRAIEQAMAEGRIQVDPFDRKYVNPASYDLTLGDGVRVYEHSVFSHPRSWSGPGAEDGSNFEPNHNNSLDSRIANSTKSFKIGEDGWLLKPGIGYLMHTHERVCTDSYVPVLDGKSSIGRLFITIHVTAGYGDPGFNGQFTLEVTSTQPVRVYAGMRFCQVRFHTISGEPVLYQGHYTGAKAVGAIPSRSWEQFEDDQKNR
jgi:dCTP deaminase